MPSRPFAHLHDALVEVLEMWRLIWVWCRASVAGAPLCCPTLVECQHLSAIQESVFAGSAEMPRTKAVV